ncbi:DNA polymerase I [Spiroplasma endosymbiont of Crioceris asparagi]|uniref:DNA polymerase I n=1 Tax=Spiroplasma endosymbiont of Crioceris asparagi TaxID=3066286 RepID=UPI0030CABF5A
MKKILLVDGNGLLFRAYHSSMYGGNQMKTSSNIVTNAAFSFVNMLLNLINKNDYYNVIVAFDIGKKTFRHDKLQDYKGTRSKTPEDLITQFPIVKEFLAASNIPYYELVNYEADDIIGTIAKKKITDYKIEILSSDKDMYQLIDDRITVVSPQVGTSSMKVIDIKAVHDKYQITPAQIIDLKGIWGDSSDNIKGISGIGEKGAIKLLTQFKTLENIYKNIDSISGSQKDKLIADKTNAFLSKEIATICLETPIKEFQNIELKINFSKMKDFFEKYEMFSLIKKFCPIDEIPETKIKYQILKNWDTKFNCPENYIYLETLDENYHNAKIIGVAISNKKGNFFINLNTSMTEEVNLFNWDKQNIDQDFQQFLKMAKFKTYDVKKTIYCLERLDYVINYDNFIYDMMLACYVLNPNIKSTIETHINYLDAKYSLTSFEETFGKGVKKTDFIENDIKALFMCQRSEAILNLENKIIKNLKDEDQFELYENLEFSFAFVLLEIEKNGVLVNKKELELQTKQTHEIIVDLENKIKDILKENIDEDFNLSSPKQLKELLYETLKLPDKFKGSTNKDALEFLEDKHEAVGYILRHRMFSKLYSTYLVGLEKYIEADSRIRSIFNQALTNTGRLSSSYPNLQNIAIRNDEQKEVRKIFIAPKEKTLISFDYSQIELRILAEVANEKTLIEIFDQNRDVHEEAAKRIFKKDTISSDERRIAKIFNFGILYGLSEFGLANDLKITKAEAKEFIDNYFKTFEDILNFKKEIVEYAKAHKYVLTLANRKRWIPELENSNRMIKSFGERVAVNAPIQGTSADILKIAMNNIYKHFKNEVKIICQIHDEIIVEVDSEKVDFYKEKISFIMKSALEDLYQLVKKDNKPKVRLEVNSSSGKNWFELK